MPRRWLLLLVAILLVALAGGAWALWNATRHTYAGLAHDPPLPAGDFTLTDEQGRPFTLSALRGQWILLAFGYTSCPDVCPTTLANLRLARSLLGPRGEQARVVFVSVDPERDTPEVLAQYVAHFGTELKGLSGTPESVAQAAQLYGVKYEKKASDSAAGYLVSHTAFVYVIDPQFRLRLTFPFGVFPQEIAADLDYLMSR